jgi:hypothetical protein
MLTPDCSTTLGAKNLYFMPAAHLIFMRSTSAFKLVCIRTYSIYSMLQLRSLLAQEGTVPPLSPRWQLKLGGAGET